MRVLRGHSGSVTALHCVTRREVWDLVGDREDAGFFISGSTDCTVSSAYPPYNSIAQESPLKGYINSFQQSFRLRSGILAFVVMNFGQP